MRTTINLIAVIVLCLAVGGCATKILYAPFSSDVGSSPHGAIPFTPQDDHISVQDQQNPKIVSPGYLELKSGGSHTTSFFTRPIASADSNKTIAWLGQLTAGTGPVTHFVTAYHSIGNTFPGSPLELRISDNQVSLIGPDNTELKTSPFQLYTLHSVFISLRLGSGTYSIKITQQNQPEISWQGQLPLATLNQLTSQPRLLLMTSFSSGGTGTYTMDDVLIREKK